MLVFNKKFVLFLGKSVCCQVGILSLLHFIINSDKISAEVNTIQLMSEIRLHPISFLLSFLILSRLDVVK